MTQKKYSVISGLAFGLVLSLSIIRSGGANHFLNGEAVGGKLYLLADKLQFKSHGFNIQNHGQIINIEEIKEVKYRNILGLFPTRLAITTYDGKTETYVVGERRLWKEAIDRLIADAVMYCFSENRTGKEKL
ncbi:MAG: hypothetical protein SGJ05_03660 [bacterium]|nr:hypothetical protein [bacterium]